MRSVLVLGPVDVPLFELGNLGRSQADLVPAGFLVEARTACSAIKLNMSLAGQVVHSSLMLKKANDNLDCASSTGSDGHSVR